MTHHARISPQQQSLHVQYHVQYRNRGRGNENQHDIPSYLRDRVSVSPLASYTTDTVEDTITTTSTTQTHSSQHIECQTEESNHEERQEHQQNQQHDDNEDEEMEGPRKRSTNRHSSSSSSTSNSNSKSSETTNNQEPTHEEMMEQRRQDALKAIRLKKYGKSRTSTSKTTQKTRKNTSVGPRRVGSASRARSARSGSGSSIGRLLGGFQSAAAAAASKKLKGHNGKKSNKEGGDTAKDKDAPSNLWSGTILLDPRAIRATISDIMGTQQREKFNLPKESSSSSSGAKAKEEITLPDYMKANLSVRLATPQDDTNIANLRLSVFSDFTSDQRRMFCEKSKEVLGYRRTKGATCIVAFLPHLQRSEKRDYEGLNLIRPEVNHVKNCDNDGTAVAQYEHSPTLQYTSFLNNLNEQNENLHGGILGSAECSTHEFVNTELGRQRPSGSIVYITEFAVSPMARRAGIGTKLLQGIELLARHRGVETLYLHVDVTNDAAIEMYTKQGFKELDSRDNPLYAEFTTKLNLHDGANTVRKNKHHLLAKDLTDRPTWVNGRGTLGFDIPQ